MTTVGIIGLGTMGLGIVQAFAAAGFDVLATDASDVMRDSTVERLRSDLASRVEAGKLSRDHVEPLSSRVTVIDDVHRLHPADLIVEAVVENLEVKQALFAKLEDIVSRNCILATNTSSLSVGAIAEVLWRPERLLGLHFFNPAPVMKLVELVAHSGADASVVATARSLAETLGKTVIECPDRPGFIVNRCARPFYGEALALLEEGRSPSDIDSAMVAAGYRLGPFGLIDLVGADINLAATESLALAMGGSPRFHVFATLRQKVTAGDLGRKAGRGFLYPDRPGQPPHDAAEIVQRIEAALVNEAAWLFSEGGTTAEGIDTAVKLGLNFPRGPFEIRKGRSGAIAAALSALEDRAQPHLKGRYRPAPGLEET
ncbi:3-hydroxyacyl-CoA dehydrogenase NAD-binding domain-containing protein [Pararhizobium sp. YC-54]|uniref:3-hydroxyacyl-CoA dehydrogenase n=1 Tax=Pararhizobium sp. YC-54 TaxID=2986920 RepID=UPI0021F70BFA|nr:3-hydroxyacyl-CoA dehydrogenase NAD-binding domain-containing protein [Pararhizobium sp. YC-54]MCV9999277.1 3-hydroxyacyl-CoA dehydrogenase NAD-binding domain-containing protein [Pararhizobium sp. YC-54]